MEKNQKPAITVVIPAYNEEQYIGACLQSLNKQDFSGSCEIIVVDNNSTDRTAQVAEKYGAKVIKENRPGVSYARQTGFDSANSPIIASTDADSTVPANWLSTIAKKFSDNSELVEFGGLYHLYSGPITARMFFLLLAPFIWKLDKRAMHGWSIPGVNMAVRKIAFEKIGGFRTELHINEDAMLSQDMKKIGKVELDPYFCVKTSGRRYRNGLLAGLAAYTPNTLARIARRPEKLNIAFKPIRTEKSLLKTMKEKLKK
ncbi:glycosyltransferase [Patescibacteria group bacterium]|nr:glycosyltransferase [Patescibacteria group bacterium]